MLERVGIAGIFVDLFSIYQCPTTNIAAANTIVSKALAKLVASGKFGFPFSILGLHRARFP